MNKIIRSSNKKLTIKRALCIQYQLEYYTGINYTTLISHISKSFERAVGDRKSTDGKTRRGKSRLDKRPHRKVD